MDQIFNEFYKKYHSLRNEVDKKVDKLFETHKEHVACKKGCDLCCMDYKILPIEFYAIKNGLEKEGVKIKDNTTKNGECIFLKNHVCTIYKHKPFICRTHGLPLVFVNNNDEWELSTCELNFKEFNFEGFTLDNTLEQDKMNSKLFQLNKRFIAHYSEKSFNETDLISLKNLYK